jgi:hypothetical protein
MADAIILVGKLVVHVVPEITSVHPTMLNAKASSVWLVGLRISSHAVETSAAKALWWWPMESACLHVEPQVKSAAGKDVDAKTTTPYAPITCASHVEQKANPLVMETSASMDWRQSMGRVCRPVGSLVPSAAQKSQNVASLTRNATTTSAWHVAWRARSLVMMVSV